MLTEMSLTRTIGTIAVRAERTERPEEERLANPFRTPVPPTDLSILGRTRWTTVTANASRPFTALKSFTVSPFLEAARAHVAAIDRPAVFDPESFYGSDVLWSISIGMRFGFGMQHPRMGRYGAAVAPGPMKMGDVETTR
jgi:hypothetical protein